MAYLIDGHNLIPKVGLRLNSPDDELQLVSRLQTFCRLTRKTAEVYFDGAPPGQDGLRKIGTIKAHFVRQGSTADQAIYQRLKKLGNSAKNWKVVSSDRQVQSSARAVQAQVISSENFANALINALKREVGKPAPQKDMDASELADWLRLFDER